MINNKLLTLYQNTSKHSNYQILPEQVQSLLPQNSITVKSRNEKERLDYILSRLDVSKLNVADIGGNTGFFSFEILKAGANTVSYYEGNNAHFEFVSYAASELKLDNDLFSYNEYIDFNNLSIPYFDCILLLNVLHHIGDDYGDKEFKIENIRQYIVTAINNLAFKTKYLVFQLGFNWKGDPLLPIFNNGTKSELISLINCTNDYFDVLSIGIAEKENDLIKYTDVNSSNIVRDDSLGEFLNRPLFILQSKKIGSV